MPETKDEVRFGEWRLIPSRHALVRSGEEVVLRAKVFHLLEYLVDRRDRVVAREELLSELWGGRAIAENSLAQCVIELRKLLGDDARQPQFIQTIPKVGYRFIATVEERSKPEEQSTEPEVLPPSPPSPVRWGGLVWAGILVVAAVAAAVLSFRIPVANSDSRATLRETAWWKLDGSAADAGGGGQDGTVGREVEWVPGVQKLAARFTGMGSGIRGAGTGILPGGGSPRTVSLWFQTGRPLVDNVNLFEYGSALPDQTPGRFMLHLNYDAHVTFGPAVNASLLTGAVRVDDGKWHLATATYEGTPGNQASLYLDGVLAGRREIPVPETDAKTDWRIGAPPFGRSTFRGMIDDVRVYKIALKQQQASALYRCSAGLNDYDGYYFLPVGYPTAVIEGESGLASLRNDSKDFSGMQLARATGDCALAALQGADTGQNLRFGVDLLVPRDSAGHITDGGPYFRSKRASPGDGIMGGTSAGYWVQLYSTGMVKVKCLNPWEMIAFSQGAADFDASRFHRLEVEVQGENLRVWLDSKLVEFEQGTKRETVVKIPNVWEGSSRMGRNEGTAGIFFGAENNRNLIGGQTAKNIQVVRLP